MESIENLPTWVKVVLGALVWFACFYLYYLIKQKDYDDWDKD